MRYWYSDSIELAKGRGVFSSYSLVPLKAHLLIARGILTSASRVTSCIVDSFYTVGIEHEITEKWFNFKCQE